MIGQTLGRYRIVALLGRGGMGEVWKAEDTLLGRAVALKFLPTQATATDRARFFRGARAASRLHHPGIADVYEAGEVGERAYVALRFVDGESLAERMARGPMSVADAIEVAAQAADALAHAHHQDVVHRDVSARNLMLGRDGRVTVVDFGVALTPDGTGVTSTGLTIGTAAYLAPELVRDAPASPASDLYGLGVVLYEMLTGSLPFRAESKEALFYQVLHADPEPPGRHRAGIPTALEALVLRLLDKDPALRAPDSGALALELRATGEESGGAHAAHRAADAGSGSARVPDHPYLLVMPFRDLRSDVAADPDPLAPGLAEALRARLSTLAGVRVYAPTGSGERPGGEDLRGMAAELGANLVLTGTLRRSRDRLRLGVSLLQAGSGLQLAATTIEGTVFDLFGFEDRLVEGVGRALGVIPPTGQALSTAPPDPAAHERYLQALGYLQRHEHEASVDGAIAILERLVQREPASARIHAALGRALLYKHRLAGGGEWLGRAAQACERAVELERDAPEVLLTLGEIYASTGQHDRAVATYRNAMAQQGESSETLIALSRSLEGAGSIADAEESVRRAIASAPGDWRGYNRLGNLYMHQSRFADAAEAWREVTRLSPDNARGWYNLGSGLFEAERREDALAAYQRSISIQPSARAFSGLGTVLFYLGRPDEAIAALEKAVALKPSDAMAWGNLGSTHRHLAGHERQSDEALERAVACMHRDLDADPVNAEGWAFLGQWLGLLGRHDAAIEALARARTLAPANARIAARAAVVLAMNGDRPRALESLRDAIDLGHSVAAIERQPVLAPLLAEAQTMPTRRTSVVEPNVPRIAPPLTSGGHA